MISQPPIFDLRSDTITRPTPAMLEAMMHAEVGDDVWGDDPTINALQDRMAALLGKEAALFVPSGTMGNQLALAAQTRPGDQIIVEDGAHIYRYEGGAPAGLNGLLVTCIKAPGGLLDWSLIAPAINPPDVHSAPCSVICLENTHNRAGGRILPQDQVVEMAEEAHARGLKVHLDGARLWHTHVATGLSLAELVAPVDTVSLCFSKALGAPVGSILVGDEPTIARAYRYRKMWGGGMRQAGYLAAACLFALDHHVARLADDHAFARSLASGLASSRLAVNHPVDTNIVIFDVDAPGGEHSLVTHLERQGVLAVGFGAGRVRLIPHLDTPLAAREHVLNALNSFTGEVS
jgi:threonine aldolase|nr:GntG family PLP-dependent aldolase [Candidatus Krumholzibacteria bacterium]